MSGNKDKSLDNRVDQWHAGAGHGQSLREFLGMTPDEYAVWVRESQVEESAVERMAQGFHDYWMGEWRKAGVTSRRGPDGQEFMLPWDELSEAAREFDRASIRAALASLPD